MTRIPGNQKDKEREGQQHSTSSALPRETGSLGWLDLNRPSVPTVLGPGKVENLLRIPDPEGKLWHAGLPVSIRCIYSRPEMYAPVVPEPRAYKHPRPENPRKKHRSQQPSPV